MAPQYKLHYFDLMGLAEPIRLIFAFANVEYEDIRINRKEQWPTIKPTMPWGKVPALQLPDGQFLSDSSAIMRYLARKFDLIGDSELDAAKCDEYAGYIVDMRQEIVKHFNAPNPEAKADIEKQLLEVSIPRYLNKFLEIIQKNGSGFLVGKRLTYADIFLAFMVGQIGKTVCATYIADKHPELEKYEKRILNQPGIKEWVAKRPVTIY